jgi:hypothetical protein
MIGHDESYCDCEDVPRSIEEASAAVHTITRKARASV